MLRFIFFILLLTTNVSWSATYYVDQNHGSASDSNAGTSESLPWLTLDHATDVVVAGDTVIVKAGTYIDTDQGSSWADYKSTSFMTTNSGTSGNPITFISSPPLAAVVRARTYPTDHNWYAWGMEDRDYIVIDGFTIEGGFIFDSTSTAVGGSDHCTLKNSVVKYGRWPETDTSQTWGAAIGGGSSYSTFENVKVYDLDASGSATNENTAAIAIVFNANHNTIKNCTVDAGDVVYSAFGQKGGGTNYNEYYNNFATNAQMGFMEISSTDHSAHSVGNVYHNNVIYDVGFAFWLKHFSDDTEIYNNTAYKISSMMFSGSEGDDTNLKIYNNIFSDFTNTGTGWVVTSHNVYYNPQSTIFTTLFSSASDVDYNTYHLQPGTFMSRNYSSYATSLSNWQSLTIYDDHSITTDPGFVNAGGSAPEDYKRSSYTANGRGGGYESVMGAYVTGSETIGYSATLAAGESQLGGSSHFNNIGTGGSTISF